jgi:hypothetical protein
VVVDKYLAYDICIIRVFFFTPEVFLETYPKFNKKVSYAYGVMTIVSLYYAFLLLCWRREGFWGYLVISIISVLANLLYTDIIVVFVSLLLILIMVGFLFVGGSKRLWNHFEYASDAHVMATLSVNLKIVKENMRLILWNSYAWPMTLFIIVSLFDPDTNKFGLPYTLELLISLPAYIALHLHIWEKRLWSPNFWKAYAFAFAAWNVLYTLNLVKMNNWSTIHPTLSIITILILMPLYIALFRYAFRKWNGQTMTEQKKNSKYNDIPWNRRADYLNIFSGLGFGFCLIGKPLISFLILIFPSAMVLTGDVYFKKSNPDGTLQKWDWNWKLGPVFLCFLTLVMTIVLWG